jgi:hypothetical protein
MMGGRKKNDFSFVKGQITQKLVSCATDRVKQIIKTIVSKNAQLAN